MALELERDSQEFDYEKVIVKNVGFNEWSICKANHHEIKKVDGITQKAIREANKIGRYVEVQG